jgi:p-cumate 2,3-dioxygenase subunit beta
MGPADGRREAGIVTQNSSLRARVEGFLYAEAALLDAWRLDEWLALLTEDARYQVPSNDQPDANPAETLFMIADDIHRLRARVARLQDRSAHAEFPHSRTRRMISNVRIIAEAEAELDVEANFLVCHFRREARMRDYVGRYRYRLRRQGDSFLIARREAVLDAWELGQLGSVSFIL